MPSPSEAGWRAFFDAVRRAPFGGSLTQSQVEGMKRIGEAGMSRGLERPQLAYVLATAFHETARRMEPVRETLADTDAKAVAILDAAFIAGKLPWVRTPYWRRDPETGQSYFGRGLPQTTHRRNYAVFEERLGLPLVANPSLALTWDAALPMLFDGMMLGIYTGRRLDQYVSGEKRDFRNARRVVNGLESAAKVAGYAEAFLAALQAAAAAQEVAVAARAPAPPLRTAEPKPEADTDELSDLAARVREIEGLVRALREALA